MMKRLYFLLIMLLLVSVACSENGIVNIEISNDSSEKGTDSEEKALVDDPVGADNPAEADEQTDESTEKQTGNFDFIETLQSMYDERVAIINTPFDEADIPLFNEILILFAMGGFEVGNMTIMNAETIDARSGLRIALNGVNVEIYVYDDDSSWLAQLKETGNVEESVFSLETDYINGSIVMFDPNSHNDIAEIGNIFMGY